MDSFPRWPENRGSGICNPSAAGITVPRQSFLPALLFFRYWYNPVRLHARTAPPVLMVMSARGLEQARNSHTSRPSVQSSSREDPTITLLGGYDSTAPFPC